MNVAKTSKEIVELYRKEVEWYKKNGKYKSRIKKDKHGNLYIAGDWSWNREHPKRFEYIESSMKENGVYNEIQQHERW